MAPVYKLTYFNIKGLAESIRFMLAYLGEDFEDVRLEREEWPSLKPKTPFGKLPVLEENGKPICQSLAIMRYLGKKAGIAGKNDWESLQIDIIADTLSDIRIPISAYMWETNEDIKKAKKETYIKETLPFFLTKLEAVAKENGGFLANKSLSWADLVFTAITDFISYATDVQDITVGYPNLAKVKSNVCGLPQIKKWLEKRPKTPF